MSIAYFHCLDLQKFICYLYIIKTRMSNKFFHFYMIYLLNFYMKSKIERKKIYNFFKLYNLDICLKEKKLKEIILFLVCTIMEESKSQLKSPTKESVEDLFTTFQTVVHLSEDLKSNHVFIVMGASVII